MIGKRLQQLRRQNGLTQKEVAKKLNVSPQTISKWENNKSAPDIDLIPILAECFRVSIDDLFLGCMKEGKGIGTVLSPADGSEGGP